MSGTGDPGPPSTSRGGSGDPPAPGEPNGDEQTEPSANGSRTALVAMAAVLAVVVVVLLVLLFAGDDDDDVDTTDTTTTSESTTTTTEATSTTSEPTSSTSEATTTSSPGGLTAEEAATVVWPDPGGSSLVDDPVAAAEAFATDLVGFTSPVIGDFQQGDSRSGEVEVRPMEEGPVTTVSVRQMSDGNWYVIAANTAQIEVTSPTAGTAIDHPLLVAGRAQAFEGTVQVAVYARGETEPLGEGFVTGSGSEMGPFSGEIAWENPGGGWGVVLFVIESGEDGSPWQAAALPVGFIGGD